jgi:lipid II:glycine glycyltransferase (peptidoglycan interpeptide bridge formation enzyme)
MVQKALGNRVFQKTTDAYSYLAIVQNGRAAKRLYTPYGPTIYDVNNPKRALEQATNDLKTLATANHLDFIRLEPRSSYEIENAFSPNNPQTVQLSEKMLTDLGFMRASHDAQPSDTLVKDISSPFDSILGAATKYKRKYWRQNQRAGVQFSVSYDVEDVQKMLRIMKTVYEGKNIMPFPDDYYVTIAKTLFPTQNAGLTFAELDNKIMASYMFYKDETTMYNVHGAGLDEFRKLSPSSTLLFYEQGLAHDLGLKWFDYFGIAPENAPETHPYAGFTSFKQQFGGTRVHTLGTWELPLKHIKYRIYRTLLERFGG